MLKKINIVTAMMVFAAGMAFAAPADIPKSGQTTSYDANTVKADDGALKKGVAWPITRFTTHADTTITDNLTGLVWAPNGNVMPTRDNNWDQDGTVNDGRVTWQHALDYVAKLNAESYLGHTDWRLPNVNELESLVHAEYARETCGGSACTTNAMWLNTRGFSTVQIDLYWSSTTYAGFTAFAWSVDMYDGYVSAVDKTIHRYVWPVRFGQ